MPTRALRPCTVCSKPSKDGRCAAHPKIDTRPQYHERHGSPVSKAEWARIRKQVLEEEPLCMCDAHRGRDDAPASTVVDHIIPHRGDPQLFRDRANLRAMSKPCHDRKTATVDGGFGHLTVSQDATRIKAT